MNNNNFQGYQETILYHYILSDNIFTQAAKPEFFSNENLKECFRVAQEHTIKYKESPSKEQFLDIIKIKGLNEKITDDVISALYNAKQSLGNYDEEWLKENVSSWIQIRNLDYVMRKSIAYMKTTKIGVENSSEVVENIRRMMTTETAIDFNTEEGSDFFDAASHSQKKLARTSSGYNYIDLCTKGGYWKGSFIVFCGGAKSGKSLILNNLAAESVLSGNNTAYVTLELQKEIVNMRIGSNLLNIPIDEYETRAEDIDFIKNKLNELRQNTLNPLGQLKILEFPTSSLSAGDLEIALKKEEERNGFKFDNIFIDYLNIMKNSRNPNSENTYLKIKQIGEDLRGMGMRNHWAVISLSQVVRNAINSSDLVVQDISESSGLLHTVDLLFGIITDPTMKAKGEYYIKCLLDRVAAYENTKKRFAVDWKYMRIKEDKYSDIQDMDYIITNNNRTSYNSNNFKNKPTQSTIAATIGTNIDDVKTLF